MFGAEGWRTEREACVGQPSADQGVEHEGEHAAEGVGPDLVVGPVGHRLPPCACFIFLKTSLVDWLR